MQTEQEIIDWLRQRVASKLDVSAAEIGADVPFTRLGIDSTEAVVITGELQELLGIKVPPTALWDTPTIKELAKYLLSKSG